MEKKNVDELSRRAIYMVDYISVLKLKRHSNATRVILLKTPIQSEFGAS